MVAFISIGLDIKKIGFGEPYSADANIWDQETSLYKRAKEEYFIEENVVQLLHPKNETQGLCLLELVGSSNDAALVSFEIPVRVFEAHPYRDLITPPIALNITDQDWQTIGLDVCDIDGFFSFLDMTESSDKSKFLFGDDHLTEALIVAQAANLEIPDHAPFVVIRLKMHLGVVSPR